MRPVTTVPRPVMVITSSTDMRKGLSTSRTGSGMKSSTASISFRTPAAASSSPSSALRARDADDGGVVAGELVLVEQLADLELDQVEELLVVDHVGLVERDDDRRHADLAGEQHVLTRLGHRAVGGGDDEDRPVDLGGTGDHVLDVVGVSGHVDVRVVALVGLVLDVGDGDGDATRLLLGGLVDLVEGREGDIRVVVVEDLGDRRGERRLAVVDVPHRSDVDVGLRPLELLLGHCCRLLRFSGLRPSGAAMLVDCVPVLWRLSSPRC